MPCTAGRMAPWHWHSAPSWPATGTSHICFTALHSLTYAQEWWSSQLFNNALELQTREEEKKKVHRCPWAWRFCMAGSYTVKQEGGSQINSIRQSCFNKNCELTVSSLKATEWGQKFASLDWWHSLRFLVFSRTGPRLSYLLVHVPYTSVYEERSHLIGQYISE